MDRPQLNIDLSQAQDIVCENCGNYTFQEVMLMKKISAIVSPTGKEAIVPIPTFACNACGFINQRFVPSAMKKGKEKEEPVKTEQKLILEK